MELLYLCPCSCCFRLNENTFVSQLAGFETTTLIVFEALCSLVLVAQWVVDYLISIKVASAIPANRNPSLFFVDMKTA